MKSLKPLFASAFIVFTASLVSLSTASAASFTVFGEKIYVRAKGKPTAEVDNFNVANTQRTYPLIGFFQISLRRLP